MEINADLLDMMKKGGYFYKHDFGRNKRGRKFMQLSSDGLKLTWKAVGANEVVSEGGGTARGILRSASFSRTTSINIVDISHIIYGPYTETFAKKTPHDRVDARMACFSLVLGESRTVDFAAEDEASLLPWLLGLQQVIVHCAATPAPQSEQWTLPKLNLQKLRLKVSGASDRSGQGPYDTVLSAILDVAQSGESATVLQAAWRKRNVQGKFQTAVQELMEISGLIEDIERKEEALKAKQDATALQIEKAMQQDVKEAPPPQMPSERDMKDSAKMQAYMLAMGEYSARQQLKLSAMSQEMEANRELTAEAQKLADEKRKLENLKDKLQFSVASAKLQTLSPADAQRVKAIQEQLGVKTPRGTIHNENVRVVTLHKETETTRLGIIFHQTTPEELATDSDKTPRSTGSGGSHVVLPIIKVLDPSGVAGSCPDLGIGDQVLSVNGQAALSNTQAVQMLRESVGAVTLAVTSTNISVTPRGGAAGGAANYSSGLRPVVPVQ